MRSYASDAVGSAALVGDELLLHMQQKLVMSFMSSALRFIDPRLSMSRGGRRCLACYASGEIADANHRAFVETARDEFLGVACLDLEGDLDACRLNDARGAGDRRAQGCGSKMPQFNLQSNRALIRFKEGVE